MGSLDAAGTLRRRGSGFGRSAEGDSSAEGD